MHFAPTKWHMSGHCRSHQNEVAAGCLFVWAPSSTADIVSLGFNSLCFLIPMSPFFSGAKEEWVKTPPVPLWLPEYPARRSGTRTPHGPGCALLPKESGSRATPPLVGRDWLESSYVTQHPAGHSCLYTRNAITTRGPRLLRPGPHRIELLRPVGNPLSCRPVERAVLTR